VAIFDDKPTLKQKQIVNVIFHPHGQKILQCRSVNSAKCFGEVNEYGIQITLVLSAFLLQLSGGEYHVHGASSSSKTTLTFQ